MSSANCCRRISLRLAAMFAAIALQPAGAANYSIDSRDTSASFDVRFLGLFLLHGRFLRTTGTLSYDHATRQGSIEVSIDTTTLVSNNAKAQSLARGPEFFEVDKYPAIDFKSSRFVFDARRLKFIEGSLTLVGNTQPVVLTVTDSRCDTETAEESSSCHANAQLVVKRSAFGMKAWAQTVSEEVTISIAITARQSPESAARKELPGVEPRAELLPKDGGHSSAERLSVQR